MSGAMEDGERKLSSPEDQTTDEQKLASWVKNKVEEVRTSSNRITHEGIWMTNIAYILGFDSVYYDATNRQFKPTSSSQTYLPRSRVRSNKILPAVQNRLARLCKSPPQFDVKPEEQTNDSKEKARLGIDLIGMYFDKNEVNKKRIELGMWLQQCGSAFLKVYWEEGEGEELFDPDTQTFVGMSGDIKIAVGNAFEIYVDPLAKNQEEVTWLCEAKVRKLDYFKDHYDRGYLVKEEGAWLLSTQYEMRINSLSSAGPTAGNINQQMRNAAIELNYYEKKSKKHKNGRHVIVANGVILHDSELAVGLIPFAKFDDVVVAGKYYGESCTTHARPLQDQFNRALARRDQWVKRLLAGKWIAARGHGLSQEALNDGMAEVIEYDHVQNCKEPHAAEIPVIPNYVYTECNDLDTQINDIYGLSDISRGKLPSSSIPALGMQILVEQDETRIGIETAQHEHSFAYVGKLILLHVEKFVKTPRKLKKPGGKPGEYLIKEFIGSDIAGHTDVIVVRGSTVPTSMALRRQDIMNAYTSGLLGNPQEPAVREQVLSWMEFGDTAELWTDSLVDNAQIARTIEEIEQGIVPEVHEMDNHVLHIIKKNRLRKSDKFLIMTPISQQILQEDLYAHLDAEAKLKNPQLGAMENKLKDMQSMTPEEGAMQNNPELAAANQLEQSLPMEEPAVA